ncbi:hypothetical protein K432DRAFT_349279 [Lepidopterella palustris CBS 459.81]|uniref:Uncharacterized protein n=1 Tax=Lepidopterella palustris CBS 459.81 TaxID=1314670 RepID=A0A8E2EED6_9PEZI|nr:hypothetical protein K432DRAFT_349279 [Lepidopterella palustris CBS 459.81]
MDRVLDEVFRDHTSLSQRNLELVTETSKLRHNLETLQKSMLSNVERFRPTQDDEIGEDFKALAAAVKVVTRDVPSTADTNKLAEGFKSYSLIQGVSVSHWKHKLHRKFLLEAAIWSVLMDTVFSTPFYVFGKYADFFTGQWMDSSESRDFSWPSPSPLAEKWRYITSEQLRRKIGGKSLVDGPGGEGGNCETDEVVVSSHEDTKGAVVAILTEILTSVAPSTKSAKIEKIVKKACDLALKLGIQRCRIQLVAPMLKQQYIAKKTAGIAVISGCEDVKVGRVEFVANPGLRKWGDGHGDHLDESLDLVPALVFIEGE